MGEPRNPHFYDFGDLGRVPEPQNNLLLFCETPGDLQQIKTNLGTFFGMLLLSDVAAFRKDIFKMLEKKGAENVRRFV